MSVLHSFLRSIAPCLLVIGLTSAAAAAEVPARKPSTDEIFRGRPFVSNRSETPPPVEEPASQPVATSAITSQPSRMIDMPDGKKVAWIPVGNGASNFDLLGNALGQMAQKMDWGGGDFAAYVEDGRYIIPIFDYQGTQAMTPASLEKIMTFAAALKLLGPTYTFKTTLLATGPIVKGVVKGNLIVRGGGDPSLSIRYSNPSLPADAPLRALANELRKKGITSIQGNILGDGSAFDAAVTAPGWPEGVYGDWHVPEVTALAFNDNLIDFAWKAERKDGSKPPYTLHPLYANMQIFNLVDVDGRPDRDWRTYERRADSNVFRISGQIPPRQSPLDSAALHKPDAMFVECFKSALLTEGVKVGGLTSVLSDVDSADIATTNSRTLLIHHSAPLGTLLAPALRYDQNLHAELIFKTMGLEHGSGGSFQGGTQAVEEYKAQPILSVPGTICIDGSGLSRLDKLTPRQIVTAMKTIPRNPGGEAILRALPNGANLAIDRSAEAMTAMGKVQALGGYMPGTHTMAGSAVSANGRKVYFAFMVNNSMLSKSKARQNLQQLLSEVTKAPLPADAVAPVTR